MSEIEKDVQVETVAIEVEEVAAVEEVEAIEEPTSEPTAEETASDPMAEAAVIAEAAHALAAS